MVFRHEDSTMEFFGTYLQVTPHSRLVWTNEEGDHGKTVTTVKTQAGRCWSCTIAIPRRKRLTPDRRPRCPRRSTNSTSFSPAWDQVLRQNDVAFLLMTLVTTDVSAQQKPATGYAPVNGLNMYYEVHGGGKPVVLLHGAFMTGIRLSRLLGHETAPTKVPPPASSRLPESSKEGSVADCQTGARQTTVPILCWIPQRVGFGTKPDPGE